MGSIPTRSRHPGLVRPCPLLAVALVLAPVLLMPAQLAAQQPDTVPPATARARPDTAPPAVPADTAQGGATAGTARSDSTGRHNPAPLAALARSLVVPGWGQAWVGRPVRGAFYFAAEAASVFMVIKSQQKLDAAQRALSAGQADSSLVQSRVSQREDWIVLSVFWAVMSGVDAWVSANLADFQHPLTPPPDGTPGAAIQVKVPVGGP